MRALHVVTLLLTAVSLLAVGCHHAAGPAAAGPMTPIGPLSPMGAGQSPALNPFGGSTRVTPPEGSFVAPNNYMGGAAQANPGFGAFGSNNQAVIGSGVQVAGWNDGSAANAPGAQGVAQASTFGSHPSTGNNPRGGGMRINDLTNAPPPPGYPAPAPDFNNQFAPTPTGPSLQPGQPWQGGVSPGFQNQPAQNPAGLQPIMVPNPAEIANQLTPAPVSPAFPPAAAYPRTATAPNAPSTAPVNPGAAGNVDPNLPWRRPGARY